MLAPARAGLTAFEPVWAAIAETRRIVAIDPPGFGASGGRQDLCVPRAMASFLIKAIDAFRLRHPHLAAADVLMASALFTALDHPGAVESLILSDGVLSPERRPTKDARADAFGKGQTEAWSELAAGLPQITTPVLLLTALQDPSTSAVAGLLSARLQRCRLATLTGDLFEGADAASVCGNLINAWTGGGYRSVALASP
jgi:pimeloyl-ACP methyl ester carboxylesterase